MRADRLLSLLMLLQTRGRMTAQGLADELEVSVRTVYRDIEALSGAGVPIYADRGPGGGCALVDNYRTQLTGLHEGEVRALFVASMPGALADLGLGAELKGALLKLLAALPAERRSDDRWVRQRIYLDWESWQKTTVKTPAKVTAAEGEAAQAPAPALQLIQQAVWHDRMVWITYRRISSFYRRQFERLVAPYGLVAKEAEWYLVCAGSTEAGARIRVYKVAELVDVRSTPEAFTRPADFDLEEAWRGWCDHIRQDRGHYFVTAHVSPQMYADLPLHLGEHMAEDKVQSWEQSSQEVTIEAEWRLVTLRFDALEEARTKLLGLGAGIEVITPVALRRSLLDYAQQVVIRYSRH